MMRRRRCTRRRRKAPESESEQAEEDEDIDEDEDEDEEEGEGRTMTRMQGRTRGRPMTRMKSVRSVKTPAGLSREERRKGARGAAKTAAQVSPLPASMFLLVPLILFF